MPLLSARRRLYWSLQVVGWGLYGLLGVALYSIFGRFAWFIVQLELVVVVVLILLSHGLRFWVRRRGWLRLSVLALLPRLLVAHVLVAGLSQGLIIGLVAALVRAPAGSQPAPLMYLGYALQVFFVMWLWSTIYFGLHYLDDYRRADIDKWKLAAAVREAEMRTLKAQINPHFLFNGLNNIRALVLENPARARAMMTHLSDLLRYSLQLNSREQVPLARELEIVTHYLALESLQLEERLHYTLDAAPAVLDVLLPPMTLQLLVENAIKHGIAPRPGGGVVQITAQPDGPAQVLITVRNPGRYRPNPAAPDHTGVGLPNAHERLQLLFGPRASLRIGDDAHQADTVTAELRLPLAPASSNHYAEPAARRAEPAEAARPGE
ncbi:histidine kinase [Hymenobacter sp.]|uniref:sensor histidine kinase n=1 Tax=Hymenobacter sp. TaxID=1898978 RepID=UPI00286D30F6|nr:histidine kinase [Hymenobacter sp.]